MVINIRLRARTTADSDDPLGRDWYGYDPQASPEQLWEHNRGDYALAEGNIARERWAALNHQGKVVLVAELHGLKYELLQTKPRNKKALVGKVLSAGHPIYEALIETRVEYTSRNSISYSRDPETAADLEIDLWRQRREPELSGQGLQMEAEIRRMIEDAAQERLMIHYRDLGWSVTDTRLNRPYDAVAVRGTEQIYLEAKGTQTAGQSVIVTRNEVEHARKNPGQCFIGIWSGMRLTEGGVDPAAGTFVVLPFSPADQDLSPRDYDWTLPGNSE